MAARSYQLVENGQHQVSGKTVVLTSLAGLVLGGPLLVMMGVSFMASLTLLLVASPLLIIFSPLLFGAGCIFIFAMAGFSVTTAFTLAGLSSFAWVFGSSFRGGSGFLPLLRFDIDHDVSTSEAGLKEYGKEGWGEYLKQKVQNPQENLVNSV